MVGQVGNNLRNQPMSTLFSIRQARPASTAWNVTKTLRMTPLLWGFFYVALPIQFYLIEGWCGLSGWRFGGTTAQTVGVILFVLGSLLHLSSNVVMASYGEGTPMTLDCPRKLVTVGPYRFVRNPMSIASLIQSLGVGIFLGSPLVLVYAVLLLLLDDVILRPARKPTWNGASVTLTGNIAGESAVGGRAWSATTRPGKP